MSKDTTRAEYLALIAAAKRDQDRAWAALAATKTICEHCGSPHFPKDTPEWAAWERAYSLIVNVCARAFLDAKVTIRSSAARNQIEASAIQAEAKRLLENGYPATS